MKNNREYRNMPVEVRAEEDNEMRVQGYASTFDEPYLLWTDKWSGGIIEYWEKVDRNAFEETDMSDVIMQYNHQGRVFARVKNGTLSVTPDDHGLLTVANLGGTEIGRQLYAEIAGGYTDKMSFGFTVASDKEERIEDKDGNVRIERTILSVGKLFDVSAVSLPANDATEISVRSLRDGVIAKAEAERLWKEQLNLNRNRVALRARALMR